MFLSGEGLTLELDHVSLWRRANTRNMFLSVEGLTLETCFSLAKGPTLETLNFAFRLSAVHQPFIFQLVNYIYLYNKTQERCLYRVI